MNLYGALKRRILSPFLKNKTLVRTVRGITYELKMDQLIDSSIYYYGCFEPDVVAQLRAHCKPGMIAFDVGANVGCHTLELARQVGPNGRVYAFEPMEWARNKLLHNLSLNDFPNVNVEAVALSDQRQTERSLFKSNWQIEGRTVPEANVPQDIEFLPLDDFIQEKRIERLDLLKLDVDGYEARVLRGARRALKEFKPVLIMELTNYTQERSRESDDTLLGLLESLEFYQAYRADSNRRIESLSETVNALKPRTGINIVLLPKSAAES